MCYSLCLGRAGKEAWEETCGLWQFLAQWFYWGLVWFFVLFCFNESLLSCCQLWSQSSCTKSLNFPLHRDMRLHHPRLKATCGYFQLVVLGNSPKATALPESDRSSRPDYGTALPLLTLCSQTTESVSHPKPWTATYGRRRGEKEKYKY